MAARQVAVAMTDHPRRFLCRKVESITAPKSETGDDQEHGRPHPEAPDPQPATVKAPQGIRGAFALPIPACRLRGAFKLRRCTYSSAIRRRRDHSASSPPMSEPSFARPLRTASSVATASQSDLSAAIRAAAFRKMMRRPRLAVSHAKNPLNRFKVAKPRRLMGTKISFDSFLSREFGNEAVMTEFQNQVGLKSAETKRGAFGWVAGAVVMAIVFGLVVGIDHERTLATSNGSASLR
jgi:hypothetical protein